MDKNVANTQVFVTQSCKPTRRTSQQPAPRALGPRPKNTPAIGEDVNKKENGRMGQRKNERQKKGEAEKKRKREGEREGERARGEDRAKE